jgi:hypothetical protein
MAFEKYLSEQGKRKATMRTPFQDTVAVAKIRDEMFGKPGRVGEIQPGDWARLDEAERRADVASELFRNGTFEK